MVVVDANVLLYAVNAESALHTSSRAWLDSALRGSETVGFAWLALLAFVRIGTNADIFAHPLTVDEAFDQVSLWVSSPSAVVVEPTPRHVQLMRDLLASTGAGGNLTSDAHLAALAIEHKATLVSFDRDFARFEGLRTALPG